MKTLCVFLVLALTLVYAAAKPAPVESTTFTTKYDNINIKEIFDSPRLYKNYLGCLMNEKKCTPDGQVLKEAIPKALKTDCDGCSAKQKEWAEFALPHISKKHPEDWKKLEALYDKEGIYRKKHASLAAQHGVTV